MVKIFTVLVRLYQKISRVCFPKTCRFYPTCSQYALDSVQKYGFFQGALKAFGRIIRCSPLSRGGYDPVR